MARDIVVTSALPYANGPIHIGHLVEYIQTDIWVKFQKLSGNRCLYFCADDTHGTPVMISAKKAGITPEQLIEKVHTEHKNDFERFHIEFDNYYSTHSPENKQLSEDIFRKLNQAGSITKKKVRQAYCETCHMALPDRFIRGTCPKCHAEDQYGDSCEVCSAAYRPTELISPYCATCSKTPAFKSSEHYFFKLTDYEEKLKILFKKGHIQKAVANKLKEWFDAGLRDWDISRDGPYFGFKIPGEKNKFFYVWLDAPIGYMASAKNYAEKNNIDFDDIWNNPDKELYHFIGKDIMYFHALFWPAMLLGSGFKTANKLFVHGFLTVNGQKMSKSRGTFIKADTYIKSLNPEYLRYYYASKLTDSIDDIDLSFDDFINKINSDLIGKFANLASRSGPMLNKKLKGRLGTLDKNGKILIEKLTKHAQQIKNDYEKLNYAAAVRNISRLADLANRFVEEQKPWVTIKQDEEKTRNTLTAVINSAKIITTYLKPILPKFAEKVQKFLNVDDLNFQNIKDTLENQTINKFERLAERVDNKNVEKMMEESKENQNQNQEHQQPTDLEPIAPECAIEDFAKIDLRIAKIIQAETVEDADKLLRLKLDVGGPEKTVLAGIAKAYNPDELTGKLVIYFANLKPREMRFGLSEGMVLAAGPGNKDIFLLSADSGAKPGQKVS